MASTKSGNKSPHKGGKRAKTGSRKRVLGRGLDALLGDAEALRKPASSGTAGTPARRAQEVFQEIAIAHIAANPFQPRDDFQREALRSLAASIRVHGVIQPVTVRRLHEQQYQLIAGERRLQACKQVGLRRVPAFVRTANDQAMLEMALAENIQREDLNAVEIALSFQRLIEDCQLKQEEVGKRVGKDRSTVTNYLRLLTLPPDVQFALKSGQISMGHAKGILSLRDTDMQLSMLQEVLHKRLSVREAERLAQRYTTGGKPSLPGAQPSKRAKKEHPMAQRLSSHYGTRVRVREFTKGAGEISIPFYSAEDFSRILSLMQV